MFYHLHKFFKNTHSYFSKSNLRLLSLFGIAFAIIVTLGLIQRQQDLRQRAAGELGAFNVYVTTGCTNATVTWTASANVTDGYLVEVRDNPTATATIQHQQVDINLKGVAFSGLNQNQFYYFTVTALSGTSKKSATQTAMTTCSGGTGSNGNGGNGSSGNSANVPGAFTLSLPKMTCNSAQLAWTASPNATSYLVKAYEGGPTGQQINIGNSNFPQTQRSYTVTGLKQSTIYTFTVTAGNAAGIKTLAQTTNTSSSCNTGGGSGNTPTPTTTKTPTSSPIPSTSITTTVTNTPSGNTANILFSLTLPGIGKASEFKNPNPKRTQRTVSVAVVNSNNTTVTSQGNLTFDSVTNSYKGTITVSSLPAGTYTIKVRFDNTLWKKLPGTITITTGANNPTTSTTQLISGDIDQNNSLAVLDYTNFVKCYQGLPSCTATMGTLADFDDDGSAKNDLDDLTILQKGFKTQLQGD